jgi:hypothetical protein
MLLQDMVVRANVVRYRRERWVTLDRTAVLVPLPPWVVGHFRTGAASFRADATPSRPGLNQKR